MRNAIIDDSKELAPHLRASFNAETFGELPHHLASNLHTWSEILTHSGCGSILSTMPGESVLNRLRSAASLEGNRGLLYVRSHFWPGSFQSTVDQVRLLMSSDLSLRLVARNVGKSLRRTNSSADDVEIFGYALKDVDLQKIANELEVEDKVPNTETLFAAFEQYLDWYGDFELEVFDLGSEEDRQNFYFSTFRSRSFNHLSLESPTVCRKASSDVEQLRIEFEFFEKIPPPLKHFFVNTFGWEQKDESGSYRMEYVSARDLGKTFAWNKVDAPEVDSLMSALFDFLDHRPKLEVPQEEVLHEWDFLYVHKLRLRAEETVAALETAPESSDPILLTVLRTELGDALEMFWDLVASADRHANEALCFSHGDLNFSNILWIPTARMVKFVDPIGGRRHASGYTHSSYDFAKLHQSIEGKYDLIQDAEFRIILGEDVSLELRSKLDAEDYLVESWHRALQARGIDLDTLRTEAASLLLSLLPFHRADLKKCLGYVLSAKSLLNSVKGIDGK